MDTKRTLLFAGFVLLVLTMAGCDAVKMIASVGPSSTPTKTPRPTFTLAPTWTETPAIPPTPEVTDTPEVTIAPTRMPTATRAVVTRRPVAPTPVKVQPTPAPSYSVSLTDSYLCEQSGIYKITARINRTGSNYFLGGYTLAAFAADGRFLKASQPSAPNEYVGAGYGGNCRVASNVPYPSNAEIDVSEFRGQLPIIIRVIRSATDHTALSPDFRADFSSPGNYYLQYNAAQ